MGVILTELNEELNKEVETIGEKAEVRRFT
jgi:hypothetical protein